MESADGTTLGNAISAHFAARFDRIDAYLEHLTVHLVRVSADASADVFNDAPGRLD